MFFTKGMGLQRKDFTTQCLEKKSSSKGLATMLLEINRLCATMLLETHGLSTQGLCNLFNTVRA